MIEAVSFGTKTVNSPDFVPNREKWVKNCWLLLHFLTDALYMSFGEMKEAKRGQYVIYRPGEPMRHTRSPRSESGHSTDYVWVRGEDAECLFSQSGLPFGVAFNLPSDDIIERYLAMIIRKRYTMKLCSGYVTGALTMEMIAELANAYKNSSGSSLNINPKIDEARWLMLKNPSEHWTVKKLAGLSGYSENRFHYLYREAYGVSPIDDLIGYRIYNAKAMLSEGKLNVTEVSEACGFSSVHYFSYCFKKHIGAPPSTYSDRSKSKK